MAGEGLQELLGWFKDNGGFLHSNISSKTTPYFGHHFIASEEIKPDSTVCTCPFGITFSYMNLVPSPPNGIKPCHKESVCGKIPKDKVSKDVLSTFFLMEQRLEGAESFWAPYINTLPKEDELTTPLYFEPEDLKWLGGTNIYHSTAKPQTTAVEERRAFYVLGWKSGISALTKAGVDTSSFSFELYLWAATIFSSRSFTSDITVKKSEEASFQILYPVIDLFNHRFGTKVVWNTEKGNFSLELVDPVQQGEQVYNNYAPKGNEELLTGYGFCIPGNPCDQVGLRLGYPGPIAHAELKKVLKDHYKSDSWSADESLFYIRGSKHYASPYQNDWGLAAIRGIPLVFILTLQIIVSFTWQPRDPKKGTTQSQCAEMFGDILVSILTQLLDKQNGIMEQAQGLPSSPQNQRQAHAKTYRDGQLHILQEVIDELTELLEPIEEGFIEPLDAFPWFNET